MTRYLTIFLLLLSFTPKSSQGACNVCHSKKPKMLHMHSALGYKDCFTCHGPAKKLPVKERINERPQDQRCMPCHKN